MMPHLTKLRIYLTIDREQNIQDAIGGLPGYCSESFREHARGHWSGELVVSCPVAPEVAEGDLIDDLAQHLRVLLNLKTFYRAIFELQIAVGEPGPESFKLESHLVALLASLGATIEAVANGADDRTATPI